MSGETFSSMYALHGIDLDIMYFLICGPDKSESIYQHLLSLYNKRGLPAPKYNAPQRPNNKAEKEAKEKAGKKGKETKTNSNANKDAQNKPVLGDKLFYKRLSRLIREGYIEKKQYRTKNDKGRKYVYYLYGISEFGAQVMALCHNIEEGIIRRHLPHHTRIFHELQVKKACSTMRREAQMAGYKLELKDEFVIRSERPKAENILPIADLHWTISYLNTDNEEKVIKGNLEIDSGKMTLKRMAFKIRMLPGMTIVLCPEMRRIKQLQEAIKYQESNSDFDGKLFARGAKLREKFPDKYRIPLDKRIIFALSNDFAGARGGLTKTAFRTLNDGPAAVPFKNPRIKYIETIED